MKAETYYSVCSGCWAKINKIVILVSKYTGIPVRDMRRRTRKEEIVRARFIAIYLIRMYVKINHRQVFPFFGYADHTQVTYALKTINNELTYDTKLADDIEAIKRQYELQTAL